MKVTLNGECGVVTEEFVEVKDNIQQVGRTKLYGLICWDTNKQPDFEDWRGLWWTFVAQGGTELNNNHQFKFINDDGTSK
ncbi:hypothetical protein ESA94_10050 [Lacibacter luteus]|uniref:Uncharacterized protein n=2 Tax=Lacibacter luteus TaxID=2508719 RepID=A0A4Q1CL44_9BACT|nr:hypothetical protein ESA94_10050 [Lacibacter luteus]